MRHTRVTNISRASAGAPASRIRVLTGPEAGTEVALPPVGAVLGADPAADVVLEDDAVSGRHCTVVPRDASFEVRDLGSRNGTLVDGVSITEARVPAGATLRLGRTLIQLLPADQVAAIEPSESDVFGEMVGSSVAMREVFAVLERAASSRRAGPAARRVGDRQGARSPGAARRLGPLGRPVRGVRLRRGFRHPHRQRAFRSRQGLVHRRDRRSPRRLRLGLTRGPCFSTRSATFR